MKKDELQRIPGIGPRIADMLRQMGIQKVSDLKGRDPEGLYQNYNRLIGTQADRCLLYVFRCAVYYAETINPEPEKLKWWHWKDRP